MARKARTWKRWGVFAGRQLVLVTSNRYMALNEALGPKWMNIATSVRTVLVTEILPKPRKRASRKKVGK